MPGTQRAGGAGSERSLSPLNFYLTEEGLAFFYPMYAIAPAVEGIPGVHCALRPVAPASLRFGVSGKGQCGRKAKRPR